jgi:hypothetical protein
MGLPCCYSETHARRGMHMPRTSAHCHCVHRLVKRHYSDKARRAHAACLVCRVSQMSLRPGLTIKKSGSCILPRSVSTSAPCHGAASPQSPSCAPCVGPRDTLSLTPGLFGCLALREPCARPPPVRDLVRPPSCYLSLPLSAPLRNGNYGSKHTCSKQGRAAAGDLSRHLHLVYHCVGLACTSPNLPGSARARTFSESS